MFFRNFGTITFKWAAPTAEYINVALKKLLKETTWYPHNYVPACCSQVRTRRTSHDRPVFGFVIVPAGFVLRVPVILERLGVTSP